MTAIVENSILVLVACLFCTLTACAQPENSQRFHDPVFEHIRSEESVIFKRNKKCEIKMLRQRFDFYEPEVDYLDKRPLIVFLHGGEFKIAAGQSAFMTKLAKHFAQMGYVTAAPRIASCDTNITDLVSLYAASMAKVRDLESLISYMLEDQQRYRIDTAQIFLAGSSSGAIVSLAAAYLDGVELPREVFHAISGGTEKGLKSPSHWFKYPIAGVINLWGAIGDTSWMNGETTPLLNIHGRLDPVIPFDHGTTLGVPIYGSASVHHAAERNHMNTRLVLYSSVKHGHDHSGVYMDSTIYHIHEFLKLHTRPAEDVQPEKTVLFPNPVGDVALLVPPKQSSEDLFLDIWFANGEFVNRMQLSKRNFHELNFGRLQAGVYVMRVIEQGRVIDHIRFIKR